MSIERDSSYDYKVGGVVPLNNLTYVKRKADEDLYKWLKAGEFCYVLNSRQMGKTSLLIRTMRRLEEEGFACANIDISGEIGTDIDNPKQWYNTLLKIIADNFDLNLQSWWKKYNSLPPITHLSKFIEEVLLITLDKNIIIFIDEIDSVLSLKFNVDDFFTFIRSCYNKRESKQKYKRLTFALFGVTTPADLIKDKQRTPFNIGKAIELYGFQLDEAQPLAHGLVEIEDRNHQRILKTVLDWTGGQPFLTQKLCSLVLNSSLPASTDNEESWLEQIVRTQMIEDWESHDEPQHLKTIRDRLLRNKQYINRLLGLYQQILRNGKIKADNSPEEMELLLSGLVVKQQGKLKIYNRIYEEIFDLNWVNQVLADLRPYAEQIEAWIKSNYQDESKLLSGQALQAALLWKINKRLSEDDHNFLTASQKKEAEKEFTQMAQGLVGNVSNAKAICREVLSWTGNQSSLSDHLYQLIRNLSDPIPEGRETEFIENLIREFFKDWESNKETKYLRTIRDRILNSKQAIHLLKIYRQVLQQGELTLDDSTKQQELMRLDLVIEQQGKLKVANRIFEYVFNLSWVNRIVFLEQLEFPEGAVLTDSTFYIERPPIEEYCYREILKPGSLIRIKAPRQMGKTSLMLRILHYASQNGYLTVPLSFQLADSKVFTNFNQFLHWFCVSVGNSLRLPNKLADYWRENFGSKNNCTAYFEKYLLAEIDQPLVLGLDEIDLVLQYPEIAADFFGLLRAWHERASHRNIWKKLHLVVVNATEVYIPMDVNQSPFNVGLPIELPELNQEQILDLARLHGLNWSYEQVEQLSAMVGGHPYLVRMALYSITREEMSLEELLEIAPTEKGLYSNHLLRHLWNLENNPELLAAMKQVVISKTPVRIEAINAFKLRSMGLVRLTGNNVLPLCQLYRQYFRDRLEVPQNIPRSKTDKFIGRERELERLHQQLQSYHSVAIAAIEGMGGIGKTELAIQYSLLHLQLRTYFGGICWLQAREQDIGLQIVEFARTKLGLHPPEDLQLPEQVRWCWQHWQQGNTLVVFDDVNNYIHIRPYLPPQTSQFKVLITTRLKLNLASSLFLEVLSETDALLLLAQLIGEEKQNQELAQAKELCQRLGYLPLALQLVGRYVKERNISLAELLRRLEEKGLAHPSLVVKENDPTWTLNVQRGIALAFELSWSQLSDDAQQLGCLLSLFALAPIPWSLVERAASEQEQEELEDARVELENLHLLQGKETYRLHQLIREFLRDKQKNLTTTREQKYNFCQAMVEVAKTIPDSPTQEFISSVKDAMPHLAEVAQNLTDAVSDENLILPFIGNSRFYSGQGLYALAQPWCEQCVSVLQSRLGEQHPHVATTYNNLAELYSSQGRYSDAEPLYQKALQLRQQLLGEEHPDIATSYNNLGNLYYSQGRYTEAEPLIIKALQLRQQLLGEEHPDIATSYNNLGNLYYSQGRYTEAESLYIKALELRQRFLGEEHPSVATTYNNLAGLYSSQGRYTEAEPLYIKALELRQRLLGEEHPSIATTYNNLAGLYSSQGRYTEAEPLYIKALELRQRLLGEEHPYVATSYNSLANLYSSQGRYTEAEPLFLIALRLWQGLLGEEHPYVATSYNSLANLYSFQGRYTEAEPLYLKALELRQRLLGEEHPDITTSYNNLANLYSSQKRYTEAEPLYLKALELRQRLLGEEHPDIATSYNNLANLYSSQKRYTEAKPLYIKALKIAELSLGIHHSDTTIIRENLKSLSNITNLGS